jgi:hypothetical protein
MYARRFWVKAAKKIRQIPLSNGMVARRITMDEYLHHQVLLKKSKMFFF